MESTETTSRLDELLAESASMKRGEVEAAIQEIEPDFVLPDGAPLGDLRAVLAALRNTHESQPKRDEPPEVAPDEPEEVAGEVEDELGKVLALREQTPQPQSALPSVAEFNASMAIANQIAGTSFVPSSYRGRPADVLAAILFGREIGLGPMTALRDVFMVDGRPVLAAHRQMALLRRGGISVLESASTAERAWIRAQRRDTGEIMEVEFTYEEASRIKSKGGSFLVDKDNWKNYPADMLWARCVGRLTRRLGPDLMNGLPAYVAEEVADFSGWGVAYGEAGEVSLSQEAPAQRQQTSRVETPKTWPEIYAWAEPYGPDVAWQEWVKDCCERLFGTTDAATLNGDQKRTLGQKASGAIVALRDAVDPDRFPPPSRAEIQKAWASVLDGEILPGPPWRLSPDEESLPTYWAAHGLPEPEPPTAAVSEADVQAAEDAEFTPLDPETEQEVEDIPFGEDPSGYGG